MFKLSQVPNWMMSSVHQRASDNTKGDESSPIVHFSAQISHAISHERIYRPVSRNDVSGERPTLLRPMIDTFDPASTWERRALFQGVFTDLMGTSLRDISWYSIGPR